MVTFPLIKTILTFEMDETSTHYLNHSISDEQHWLDSKHKRCGSGKR